VGAAVAQMMNCGEGSGISTGERGNARENFVGLSRRLFIEVDERVTEQNEDAGAGVGGSSAESGFVFVSEEKVLAELEEDGAKVVFDLNAMEIHGDGDGGNDVSAEENAVVLLHVEEFNGENIGGGGELRGGEEKRRRFVLVFAPPLDGGGNAGKFARGEGAQNAGDVEIGVGFVEVAASGGAIENYGLEIVGGEFFEAANQVG